MVGKFFVKVPENPTIDEIPKFRNSSHSTKNSRIAERKNKWNGTFRLDILEDSDIIEQVRLPSFPSQTVFFHSPLKISKIEIGIFGRQGVHQVRRSSYKRPSISSKQYCN